jgi:NADH dehydrogenase (ubiquinone) Fe-S protein 1
MARCSAAKATGNPKTNFMAAGEQDPPSQYPKALEAGA